MHTQRSTSFYSLDVVSQITFLAGGTALAWWLFGLCLALAQTEARVLTKDIQRSVASITAYDKDGHVLTRGNGFFVRDSGLLMTRRTLVPTEARRIEAKTFDGQVYKITGVVEQDISTNLATVATDLSKRKITPLLIAESLPTVGERVLIVTGSDSPDNPFEYSVSNILEGPFKIVQLGGRAPAGSMGSPIINLRGEVIGIVGPQKEDEGTLEANAAPSILKLVNPAFQRPQIKNNPEPEYTLDARRAGVEGTVTLRALIGADGLVQQVKVLKGLPFGLTDQAIKAAFKMKFKPATKNGTPTQFWIPVVIEFHLRR